MEGIDILKIQAKLADALSLLAHKGHDADCPAVICRVCGSPPSDNGNHYFRPLPSHNFTPGPCSDTCGIDRALGVEG